MVKYVLLLALLALTFTACAKKQVQETTAATQAVTEAPTTAAPTTEAPTTAAPETTPVPETTAPAAFDLSEIHNITSAEAIGEFGTVKTTSYGNLRWIEQHLSTATKLNGWPNCPYDMIIRLTRNDGQVFEFQPATDSCDNMLIGGNDWYCFNNGGSNVALFDIFNLKAEVGNVTKREPLPKYQYSGDNGVLKALTEYNLKKHGYDVPDGAVALPEYVIHRIADDGNGNVTVYGNFRMMVYSRRDRTLVVEAGGNEPAIAHLKKTGDNTYEVVDTDMAGDADEWDTKVKKWCNGDKELYSKYEEGNRSDSEHCKKWKSWWIYNYVKDNNLPFTETQDGKWDPEPIEPIEEMPEM